MRDAGKARKERLMRMGLGKMLLCSCMAAFVFLTGICFAAEDAEREKEGLSVTQEKIAAFEKTVSVRGVKNAGFSDLGAGHWAYEEVSMLADAGVLDGYPDGCFRPAQEVSYGEFIKMVCAAVDDDGVSAGADEDTVVSTETKLGAGEERNIGLEVKGGMISEDIKSGHWAQEYYDAALEAGFLKRNVIEAGMLDMKIPRKHMAHIAAGVLGSAAENAGNDGSSEMSAMEGGHIKRSWIKNAAMPYSEAAKLLSDVSAAGEHGDDIIISVAAGVLTGYPDGAFKGDATLTRAEAAAVTARIMRIVRENEAGQTGEAGSEENAAVEEVGKVNGVMDDEGATGEVIVRKVQKGETVVDMEYRVYEKSAAELGIAKIEQESRNTIKIYAEKKYPFVKIMLEDGMLLKSVGFPGGSFYEENGYFVYVADPKGLDLSNEIAAGDLYLVVEDVEKRAYRVSDM